MLLEITCSKLTVYLTCVITLQIHPSTESTSVPAPLFSFHIKTCFV